MVEAVVEVDGLEAVVCVFSVAEAVEAEVEAVEAEVDGLEAVEMDSEGAPAAVLWN